MAGTITLVPWTDDEWTAILANAAKIAADKAAQPVVKTVEERLRALEAKVL